MTKPVMSFDVETHAWLNLKIVGAAAYLNDPGTDVALFAYHLIGSPELPKVWYPWMPVPQDLIEHVQSGGLLSGWNVLGFDRLAWEVILVPRFGFPDIDPSQWADTMFLASSANLPRSLDGCAKAVGVPYIGDLKDNNILRRITNKNVTPIIQGADLEWLSNRCVQDCKMEEETLARLPPWPTVFPWNRIREIDQKINARGILMDVELVKGLEKAAIEETARIDIELKNITNGAVPKGSQIEKLKLWLLSRGVNVPLKNAVDEEPEDEDETEDTNKKTAYRLRKSDIADLLATTNLPDDCRIALEYRAEIAKASVKKLKRMLADMCPDGRLRGALILGGAQSTMRWSGAAWQPHNFVRDTIANPDEIELLTNINPKKEKTKFERVSELALNNAIMIGRSGDRDLIESAYTMTRKDAQDRTRIEGVLPFIGRMLRRTLVASEGHLFLNGDYSQIEARIPMWLSEQYDKIAVFERNEDIYRVQAAPLYNKRPEELTKTQRQIGKVQILFLGFAGGVGAFVPAAMNYGLRITKEDAEPIVRSFRDDNAQLVDFWNINLRAAVNAVMHPGSVFYVAPKNIIAWCMDGNCLCCRLPSGRLLRYWAPRLQQGYWQDSRAKTEPDLTVLAIKGRAIFRRTLWRGL